MIAKVKESLQSGSGPVIAVVVLAVGALALYFTAFAGDGKSELEDISRNRLYVTEDGKAFRHEIKIGEAGEIMHEGKRAWRAELCYWTKDGKPKAEPTAVLLNDLVKKPGPTFCPDCGRLVRALNPSPEQSSGPPPTKEEYESRNRGRPPAAPSRRAPDAGVDPAYVTPSPQ